MYPDYPSSITLAELRLRWEWDSLRSNPRFQKILAGPEPKTNLTIWLNRSSKARPASRPDQLKKQTRIREVRRRDIA